MKFYRFFLLGFLLLGISFFLTGCNFPLAKKKKAALKIFSNPQATVFLNGNHMGQTPFSDETLKPGEYKVKLIPSSQNKTLFNWQGIVRLNSGIMSIIKRDLAETEEQSSGYTLSLEPMTEKDKVKIVVISTPDSVVVNLDGEPKGFTPLVIDDVIVGDRLLTLSSNGFQEQKIQAKAIKGYKLIINAQLAKKSVAKNEKIEEKEASKSAELNEDLIKTEKASGSAKISKPYIKVKKTPTGWLNVRSEPSTAGKEETVLIKIYPGEKKRFIEANKSGWYKIEYGKGKQGWISSRYVELFK